MELALPLPWHLLWFCLSGLSCGSLLRSSLVRFQNGTVVESEEPCTGIVLLVTNQTRSLVCDKLWGVESLLANVVCHESGCGKPNLTWTLQFPPPSSLGAVQGLRCTGEESSVNECEHLGEAAQDCVPQGIAAVTCERNITQGPGNSSMRLSRGRNSCDGHVEVFTGDTWSPVCFTGIKDGDIQELCTQLDCEPQNPLITALHRGQLQEAVMFQCSGNQTLPWECDHEMVDVCQNGVTTYLQCHRPRMEESWMVWTAISLAVLMIVALCWVRVAKTWKCCTQSLNRHLRSCCSGASRKHKPPHQSAKRRRNIYRNETPSVVIQEILSAPSSPGALQDPGEVNALLAPHGFRLNNTITPPPSYMHALKILSRPLENTQTPPPSYLEALKILSRPVLVHVHATDCQEEKEDLAALKEEEKRDDAQNH
ncbi:deleted in malignant brain tumors 1 protein-like [Spea bombifrons]|uniref:deleted in malignant brain tumors 1 protein-like n=1 Tax=Spea bombifrons TaxID=233779 RepID=UPI00234AE55F|nr:deleted in malignant brain tumors 1 protein-like [Spea bombifrons]